MGLATASALALLVGTSTTGLGEAGAPLDLPWAEGAELALLDEDAPLVTGASRRRQTLAEAPVSVTLITAEQIRVHGWDSLGEILGHVRGFYVSDDLNFEYLGVRGFMRPGDYNSRVLVLIDGHALADPVFLATSIGRDVIEPTRIERIEIIRGPGSALYGGAALLAVINVVTRTGPDPRTLEGVGVAATARADTRGRGSATVGFDRWLGSETRLAVTVAGFGSLGSQYVFPELGSTTPTARASDREGGLRVFSRFEHGPLSVHVGYTDRYKEVPTAAFGTVPEAGLGTHDRHLYGSGQLQLEVSPGVAWSTQLAAHDYAYYGFYPYTDADGGPLDDYARGTQLTLESTLVAELHEKLVLNVGLSGQRSFALDTWSEHPGDVREARDLGYGTLGVFADAELRLIPGLSVYAGGRIDVYETFGVHASPRLAVVFEPWAGTVLRGSFGTAFRAPNAFELYYIDLSAAQGPRAALDPEVLQQFEGSAEQTLFEGRAQVGAAVYRFDMRDLIDGVLDAEGAVVYANAGTARALGGELWGDVRLPFLDAHVELSYSASLARDLATGAQLSASPLHSLSGTVDFSLGVDGLRFAAAGRYVGDRRGTDGATRIPGAVVVDTAVSWRDPLPGLDLALGVKNTFDATWYVPSGIEHVQRRLPQEGISAWVRVSSAF